MGEKNIVEPLVSLKISEEVFKKIAEISALETKGVLAVATRTPNFKESFLSTKKSIKEIYLSVKHNIVDIEISIIVDDTKNIVSLSREVQKNIKNSIQSMTGMPVSYVKVNVSNMTHNKNNQPVDEKIDFIEYLDEDITEKIEENATYFDDIEFDKDVPEMKE